MNKTKISISAVVNLIIFMLVVMATVFMLTGFHFMGEEMSLSAKKWYVFRYFTVDSNILMGVAALIFAVYEALLLSGKIDRIPEWLYLLKHIGTVCVTLTMLTTVCFLAPFLVDNYWSLFLNANLFFHLIIPLLSVAAWMFLENTKVVTYKRSLWAVAPMLIYGVFYSAMAFSHMVGGKVDIRYDWYGFAQGGVLSAIISMVVMTAATVGISSLLFFVNRKITKK